MNGIVLWYKNDKKIGLVWCDDQGPLACVTAATVLEGGVDMLEAGDQIVFEGAEAGGMREVRQVISVRRCASALDVQALLSAEADRHLTDQEASTPSDALVPTAPHLRVVA